MAERYSAEQVQQILVAAMGQGEEDGFSRSQLAEMATDLGISPDALRQAEQVHQALPAQSTPNPTQQNFRQQLRTYAVVNTFLLALNVSLSGTITWAIYPLLGWGLGLLLPEKFSPCTKAN
ncbi:MAG: 2TM domain-containing protein [Cyanobacteria bacterium J06656_5]